MKLRKILALCMAATMIVALTACGSSSAAPAEEAPAEEAAAEEEAEEPEAEPEAEAEAEAEAPEEEPAEEEAAEGADYSDKKVGLLLSGSANDGGWSQMAADAVTKAAEEYGCETNFSESLAATDFESTMRGYADAGYDVIVAHGAEFLDTSKLVSADYPDITFINTSAMEGKAPNLAALDMGSYQTGALSGYICGMASDSGKIGLIGALEGATTVLCFEAFETAAKAANPNADVTVVYTGSYDDQLKAKQACQELIEQGCDVICENADYAGIGAIQYCDEAGVINVVQATDYHEEGESVMMCVPQYVDYGITVAVERALEGTLDCSDGATMMDASAGVVIPTEFTGIYADKLTDEQKATWDKLVEYAKSGGLWTEEDAVAFYETLG